jgi:integrase/recombinase XerC/integrase/recombinase XerD
LEEGALHGRLAGEERNQHGDLDSHDDSRGAGLQQPGAHKERKMAPALLHHAVEDFFDARQFTPKSTLFYEQALKRFVTWANAQGVMTVQEVDTRLLRRYFKHLRESISKYSGLPLAGSTVQGQHTAVMSLMHWALAEYGLPAEQVARVERPKAEKKVIATFNNEQLLALLAACDDEPTPTLAARNRAMLSLFIDTGARLSELTELTLDRVHLTRQDPSIQVLGKGRKYRVLGLGRQASRTLETYLRFYRERFKGADVSPFVFLTQKGLPLDNNAVHRVMRQLGERAGIRGVRCSAHTLRHSMAVAYLARDGADVFKLSRILGHENVSTTSQVYLADFQARQARHSGSVLDSLGSSAKRSQRQ